jgi:hypothetical protein
MMYDPSQDGRACDGPCQEHFMKEVVEIGHPLVGRRAELRCWLFVELHDFRVRRSRWLVSPRA